MAHRNTVRCQASQLRSRLASSTPRNSYPHLPPTAPKFLSASRKCPAGTRSAALTLPDEVPERQQPGRAPPAAHWACHFLEQARVGLAGPLALLLASCAPMRGEGEREKQERGTCALCFHICVRDAPCICLIEFGTQREPPAWEVESGGARIKSARDFYTWTMGENAKQPSAKGSCLMVLSGRVCCACGSLH